MLLILLQSYDSLFSLLRFSVLFFSDKSHHREVQSWKFGAFQRWARPSDPGVNSSFHSMPDSRPTLNHKSHHAGPRHNTTFMNCKGHCLSRKQGKGKRSRQLMICLGRTITHCTVLGILLRNHLGPFQRNLASGSYTVIYIVSGFSQW